MTATAVKMPGAAELTLGAWLADAADKLARAGVESPRLDARLLAGHGLGWDAARVLARPEHSLSAADGLGLDKLLARRERREPLAAITGRREFWGLDFAVTGATLVPRPDSETLVEAALASVPDRGARMRVLDLGTGSGCLLVALLSELPCARGLGVDASEAALAVARLNAKAQGLAGRARFRQGDWGAGIRGGFELVVANPPYVADPDFAGLAPEVARFEPRLALSGGADGLRCYRALAPWIGRLLVPGGRALVEIGAGQADAVAEILRRHGLRVVALHRDLAARPRVLEARGKIRGKIRGKTLGKAQAMDRRGDPPRRPKTPDRKKRLE
ncbi:MAG: peptide chain release factor N(5)-glutamine methyltransferase [Rhodospirillales bacterium]